MKIYWTDESYEALKEIQEYISRDSEFFACRMIERIYDRETHLTLHPLMATFEGNLKSRPSSYRRW